MRATMSDQEYTELREIDVDYKANQKRIRRLTAALAAAKRHGQELHEKLRIAENAERLPNVYGDEIKVDHTDSMYDYFTDGEELVIVAYAHHFPLRNDWMADVEEAVKEDGKYCFGHSQSCNWEHGFKSPGEAIKYANELLQKEYGREQS